MSTQTRALLKEIKRLEMDRNRYERRFGDAQSKLHEWQEFTGYSCPSVAADEIERLRAENAWMKSCLQSHSLHMDGTSSWRWRGGWPLSAVRAGSRDAAVAKAIELAQEGEQ